MALSDKELLLSEAIKNALSDVALGTRFHKSERNPDDSNSFTFLHEEIEQTFRLKAIDLEHHDTICASFAKIHSHKYLNDPTFALSFKKEMTARAVPLEEQKSALEIMGKVISQLLNEKNEKDAGWHPNMDEIIGVSQPEQIKESIEMPRNTYDIESKFYKNPKVRKWINEKPEVWESINKRIVPDLVQLGYICEKPEQFWKAYDDEATEFVMRNSMHIIYEDLAAEFETNA